MGLEYGMSVKFDKSTDLLITDPCYLQGENFKDLIDKHWDRIPKHAGHQNWSCLWDILDKLNDVYEAKVKDNPRAEVVKELKELYMDSSEAVRDYIYNKTEENSIEVIQWAPIVNQLEDFGLTRSLMGDTVFGDWSCVVIRRDGSRIGKFCAASGQYIVADVAEVRKGWPGLDQWIAEHNWCATIVQGFQGEVRAIVDNYIFKGTEDKMWHVDKRLVLFGKADIGRDQDFLAGMVTADDFGPL